MFFDKVFADDTGHVNHFKNFARFRCFSEISDVVKGESAGRENDKERIIAYNIGVPMHDINYAAHMYQMFNDRPEALARLAEANLHETVEKFWI